MRKTLVIGFYSHPEYYPPVLNALEYLSRRYDTIYLVHRNYPAFGWKFPSNIEFFPNGKPRPIKEHESSSTFQKVWMFLKFTFNLLSQIKKNKADTVLLYDSLPMLAFWLIRPFIRKPRVTWYHNHDVTDPSLVKKYSLSWWSLYGEKWIFPTLDIFTLPSESRKTYFSMNRVKGKYFFLPNFPSKALYEQFSLPRSQPGQAINLTYQGFLGEGHGLEEIITFILPNGTGNRYQLFLKGFIFTEYKEQLTKLAQSVSVQNRVFFQGFIPYAKLPASNTNNQIGIAIYTHTDIMNATIATASNKIYEYAAQGMPVIVYDNVYFKSSLEKYKWIFFTDCSEMSLNACLTEIVLHYEQYSTQAVKDFKEILNFEHYCLPVLDAVALIK